MSTYWKPYCETCREYGPPLRSGVMPHLRVLQPDGSHADSTELLKQWLDDHEFCSIQLLREGALPRKTT